MHQPPTFLMTDPAHYAVCYEINPWMRPAAWSADPGSNGRKARAAWTGLKDALIAAGGKVLEARGAQGLPDMVFPANAAIVLDRRALLARFRHPERQGEEAHFARVFADLVAAGVLDEAEPISEGFQEGAGDAIWDEARRLFWVGSGPRSSAGSARLIARHFAAETVCVPLASERYYHLDTCFRPLPGGEILHFPAALTAEALTRLRARVEPDLLIEATAEEAQAFCVNAVAIGRRIIMASPPPSLAARLQERGYDIVGLDLSPFILSGGAAFCMTLRLDHVWASAARPIQAARLEMA